jgi:flagellar hook-associated protein 3 FlgL
MGDAATDNARQTALARVDDTITVAYGARANEQGIRVIVQNMAVFAAMTFSPADADGRDRYMALAGRVGSALFQPADQQRIDTIQTEIAGANVAAGAAKERLAERKTMLLGLIDEIERVSPEEVGFLMLTLNTRMQATMQTTAMLSRFTLLDFM